VKGRPLYLGVLAVFAALSATDFVQTYTHIRTGGGRVYEANPVAAAWLEWYGWSGLAAFKAGCVVVLVGTVILLAGRSRRTATAVAGLGCAALLAVTLYSHDLLAAPANHDPADDPTPEPGRMSKLLRPPYRTLAKHQLPHPPAASHPDTTPAE
jgi:hypothetical protein